jgi:glucose/arabinose dehydrogenase
MRRGIGGVAALAAVTLAAGCGSETGGGDPAPGAAQSNRVVATGLSVPWGVAFLPGGDALVSERTTGRIVRVSPNGRKRTVMRLPGVDTTSAAGEGGLLGLALSPGYRSDGWVYAYYTSARDNRIVRFRLGEAVQPLVTGIRRAFNHNGGRIAFGPDGKLYAGVGDAESAGVAQNRNSRNGKILRMNPDGSVPADNPFGNLVWSTGHRNVQGLAWDPRGRLWATEFGQSRFDEVNLIRRGGNYGWPEVEGRGSTEGGRFINPKVTWRTNEASPSGAAIRRGTMYIGALRGESVLRLRLRGTRASKLSPLLRGAYGRIRTVQRKPDGSLWVTTSNRDGRGDPRRGDDRVVRIR